MTDDQHEDLSRALAVLQHSILRIELLQGNYMKPQPFFACDVVPKDTRLAYEALCNALEMVGGYYPHSVGEICLSAHEFADRLSEPTRVRQILGALGTIAGLDAELGEMD